MEINMQEYDDSAEWWEDQEVAVYGEEIEDFEWDEVDDEQAE
jgi:hypothetical protein